jgi:hypothetical protein
METEYIDDIGNWKDLANAIIAKTCEDYLSGVISSKTLKRFLCSEYCSILSDIDPDYLYEKVVARKKGLY